MLSTKKGPPHKQPLDRFMSWRNSFLFVAATHGHQMDLMAPKLDLELITDIEVKHCGLGLAESLARGKEVPA